MSDVVDGVVWVASEAKAKAAKGDSDPHPTTPPTTTAPNASDDKRGVQVSSFFFIYLLYKFHL